VCAGNRAISENLEEEWQDYKVSVGEHCNRSSWCQILYGQMS